jgi:hypothetical protein
VGSQSRGTEARRFEDSQALGVFHPNEATVTCVTLFNISNPQREIIAEVELLLPYEYGWDSVCLHEGPAAFLRRALDF